MEDTRLWSIGVAQRSILHPKNEKMTKGHKLSLEWNHDSLLTKIMITTKVSRSRKMQDCAEVVK
jgi:hypothetical protein